jgi:predicted DNA-binding transcriptional regulator YafY
MEEPDTNGVGEKVGRPRFSRSHRLVRALRLGRIITSSTQPLDYKELARSSGVSRRTLFRDLSLLRSAGIESPHARKRHASRTEPTGELLGQTLTFRETAAILELLEHDHQPKPDSAYDRALRDAKQKIILALRGKCSAILAELEAIISTFHNG